MTSTRAFLIALASFTAQLIVSPAEAGHRSRVQQLDPGCNVIFPCTPMAGQTASSGGLFGRARSIRVTMHRDRKTHHGAPKAQHEASHPHATKLQDRVVEAGRGVVKSASGAVAYVAGSARGAFQCVVDALEAQGYPVREMGGFANRGHVRHSLHYSGLALDVNQDDRNVTRPPMPANEIELANGCGLVSGRQWRGDPDSGHFQLGGWDGHTLIASARHHHRTRYARQRRDHRYAGAG